MPAPRSGIMVPSPESVRHELCWAKTTSDGRPGVNVRDHCLNVGCVAEALIDLLPEYLRRLLPAGIATLAALHDIGKVSPGFQVKCASWLEQNGLGPMAAGWSQMYEGDHARVSQWTVQELLGASRLSRWAAAVGAHHGRIKGERLPRVGAPWEEERRRLAEEFIVRFGPLPETTPEDPAVWFAAGLITTADWIGSNEDFFPQGVEWGDQERRRRARIALARAGWEPTRFKPGLAFEDLFPGKRPNDLQAAALEIIQDAGAYVIEGPMGCGKTEAALAAAYRLVASGRANGIYFALPTQVTSNRIFLRVGDFLKRAASGSAEPRLAHSTSWLLDSDCLSTLRPSYSDDEARHHVRTAQSWFASPKRALLAPFGVGTIDQALLGIVAAKHFFLRQFGLAGKVVILDEVHSYDMYTGTLIDALARRLLELRCTVIILSATLTRTRRRELLQVPDDRPSADAYPLLSGGAPAWSEVACAGPDERKVSIRLLEGSALDKESLARAERGECVLWIRNTVDEAQKTFRGLKAAGREGGPPIALLHSRFPFFRREELEEHWMRALGPDSAARPTGCVLVSTQVAEQSVDIDADILITDLAPTDMLLQRLGRLWRHTRKGRPGRPEMWIEDLGLDEAVLEQGGLREVREILGKSARVYAPYVLIRSLAQWRTRETIALPREIRVILEATYADPAPDESRLLQELRRELEEKKRRLSASARSTTLVWSMPELSDEEGVQTRYGAYPMLRVLLATKVAPLDAHSARVSLADGTAITAHDRAWDFEAAKAIHRNLVPVPQWTVPRRRRNAPGWLENHVSQSATVALLLPGGELRWLGEERDSGLEYQRDQGIMIHHDRLAKEEDGDLDESCD